MLLPQTSQLSLAREHVQSICDLSRDLTLVDISFHAQVTNGTICKGMAGRDIAVLRFRAESRYGESGGERHSISSAHGHSLFSSVPCRQQDGQPKNRRPYAKLNEVRRVTKRVPALTFTVRMHSERR